MQPGTAMCFLNFYTLVFWTPLSARVKQGAGVLYAVKKIVSHSSVAISLGEPNFR